MKGEGLFYIFFCIKDVWLATTTNLAIYVFRQKLSDVHTKLSDVCPKPSDEQQKPSDEDCSATLGRLFNLLIIFVSQVDNLRIVNKLLI